MAGICHLTTHVAHRVIEISMVGVFDAHQISTFNNMVDATELRIHVFEQSLPRLRLWQISLRIMCGIYKGLTMKKYTNAASMKLIPANM